MSSTDSSFSAGSPAAREPTAGAKAFTDPGAVSSYVSDTPRKVPGLADLHRMTTLLLDEHAPEAAHILVVGAGGGLELKAMAEARPGWRFDGVDPSAAMLDIARRVTAPHAEQIALLEGTVDQTGTGPYDGATCLLTLHFLDRDARLHTLQEIRRRLKPGGVIVVVHHAAADGNAGLWLERSAAFANRGDADRLGAAASARAMRAHLPLLAPDEEEALLREAGFSAPALFYAAFSFRGWVAIAG